MIYYINDFYNDNDIMINNFNIYQYFNKFYKWLNSRNIYIPNDIKIFIKLILIFYNIFLIIYNY